MAGVKGRSGGARPGSGRKPKAKSAPAVVHAAKDGDPKDFLIGVMDNKNIDEKLRIDAAKALLPYLYPKIGEGGKKEAAAAKAKSTSAGKFAPAAPPKLVVSNAR